MKKSFLYVVPAALILALLFAGCPQDSDDDDDSGGKPVTVPGSDLSYIAYAFGDGIDTVKAVNPIYLGSNELVIPRGKTLDLATKGVEIKSAGLTGGSKIIAQGTIRFASGQNYAGGLDFTNLPDSAKIIADRDFINSNVWIDYTKGGFTDKDGTDWSEIPSQDKPSAEKNTAVIRANWQQIVLIDTFEKFEGYSADDPGYIFVETFLNGGNVSYKGKYLAIEAPSNSIGGLQARTINERAKGLRLYLVGEPVVFNSPETIDLSGSTDPYLYYKEWKPKAEDTTSGGDDDDSSPSLFAYAGSGGDGSLTVAGNADVRNGQINAPGGLTVWGVLENTGEPWDSKSITGGTTPVTAWTTILKGAEFGGKVYLLGSITNIFGPSVKFGDSVEISGPSLFNGATFEKSALFNGATTFVQQGEGSSNQVTFKGSVTFADNAYLHSGVTFENASSENEIKRTFYKTISGLPYTELVAYKFEAGNLSASVEVPLTDIKLSDAPGGSFSQNMVFSAKDVTVKDGITFAKNATFEGNVTFNGKSKFGTVSAGEAAKAAGSRTTTIIKGLAEFRNGADFGGTLVADPDNQGGLKAIGNTVILEEAKFNGVFENITDLQLGNSESPAVVFTAGTTAHVSGSGAITIPSSGGMEFKDRTLTFTGNGGTLGAAVTLNNATIKLNSNSAKVVFSQSQLPIEVIQADGTGTGSFEITGKAKLDAGKIEGEVNDVVVIKANGGIMLNVPGGPPAQVPTGNATIGVYNALIDLSKGGAIVFVGTASRIVLTNANIKLHEGEGGLAIPTGQTWNDATIMAGNSGGSAALLTGSSGVDNLVYNNYAGTRAGGTYSTAEGWSDMSASSNVLNSSNSFILVGTQAKAGSISVGSNPGNETGGGFIAVFTSEGALQ
jgi:hypothetical protein